MARQLYWVLLTTTYIDWTTWRTRNCAPSPNETWILNGQTLILISAGASAGVFLRGCESMIFKKNRWFVSSDVVIHGELRKPGLLRFDAFAAVAQSSVTATYGEERMTPRKSGRRGGLSRRLRIRIGAETLHDDDVPNHCLRLKIISLPMMGITCPTEGGVLYSIIGEYDPSWIHMFEENNIILCHREYL